MQLILATFDQSKPHLESCAAKTHLSRSLALSYHTKDLQALAHQSFFWYHTEYTI